MQAEQAVGLGVITILGAATIIVGTSAFGADLGGGPGGGAPACQKKIVLIDYMSSSSGGCSSYTDCDQSYACQNGTQYKSCGSMDDHYVYGWCRDYINGVWDANLGRCVGGHASGSYYDNGFIPAYPNPVFCD